MACQPKHWLKMLDGLTLSPLDAFSYFVVIGILQEKKRIVELKKKIIFLFINHFIKIPNIFYLIPNKIIKVHIGYHGVLGWIEPKRRRSPFLSLLFLWCAGRGTGKSPKVFENVRRADAARDWDRNGQQALLCVRRARKIRMAHWSSHSSNLIYHVNGIDSPFLDWMPFIYICLFSSSIWLVFCAVSLPLYTPF